jgi:hypothetical protein
MAKTLTMTPADILKLQSEYVRTGKYLPLGRMQKISIGPEGGYVPPPGDLYIQKYGRMIELRDRFLPIAHSLDKTMILVTAPLMDRNGRVGLPDVPDPDWTAPPRTIEEIEGVEKVDTVTGRRWREPFQGDASRYQPRMIPQNLRDRTNRKLEGSNFLVFSPVERILFQPEIENRLIGTAWWIDCKYSHVDQTYVTLLIDEATGETHFFGGMYDISAPAGG